MNSIERTCGNKQKIADADSSLEFMTLQDGNNFIASEKDCEVWSFGRRNSNQRCRYFTLLTPDSNGNWRAVAVPFHSLDVRIHAGSQSQSFTDGNFPGQKEHYQSRNKALTSKGNRGDAILENSVRHSSFNNNRFNFNNISDKRNGKFGKKNNTKKAKKKGKRNRKLSADAGPADVKNLCENATNKAGSSKNTDPGSGSTSWETASTVLSPDSFSNSSEDICGSSNNYSEMLDNTNIDTVDISEENDSLVLDSISVFPEKDDIAISSSSSLDMRNRGSRKVARNSNVFNKSSLRNFRGHFAENNNTSWQDKCSSGLGETNSFNSQGINNSKIQPFARKNRNVSQYELLSKDEDNSQPKMRNYGNPKRRTNIGSKQELNSHSRKFSYASKSTSNLCAESGTELNNAENISPDFGWKKRSGGISRPISEVDCTRINSEAEKINSTIYGHMNQLEGRSNEAESIEKITSKVRNLILPHFEAYKIKHTKNENLERANGFSATEQIKHEVSKPFIHKLIPGIKDPELARSNNSKNSKGFDKEAIESVKLEDLGRIKNISAIKHNNYDQISGPFMHNGIKDSELTESSKCVSEKTAENFKLEKTAMEISSSEFFDCSVNSRTECFGQGSRTENSMESAVDINSDKILKAVNEAHKAQLASENVEKAIGYPVAEIERFLHAASPVISVSNNISPCPTCSPDEMSILPLCRHNIPNFSLGKIWEWYEKHGIFGLEVKAEDNEYSKRIGIDSFTFRAYFVPYLSAAQIFRPRRKCSSNNGGVQIFSVLIPKPKIVGSVTKQFNDDKSLDELELVYEFFEAERPQNRRPLFEMINNLVSSNEPLQGKAFGDPSKLVSMEINDLHPRSWYSVAWYPIYRIPDEKFQSAFLTYHSLGHFVNENASSDSFAGNNSVVSPVVGLQGYNTQGECWLRPRNNLEENTNYNNCEILKERMRTLENTASVMARAEVVKENTKSVNIQSDYEFFLSRRRW